MGVPILGGFDAAAALWADGAFDALISTVVRDVRDRAEIFQRFTALGIPFTNVIDPDVRIGADVRLGKGNLIIYGGYLATAVTLGDDNFLAAGTFIEHHSEIGSHCTFGPRSSLSGKVKVGDLCKFGTQVAVEPQVEIGAQSLIASGVVLTTHVPPRSIVKSTSNVVIRNAK
jgi:acetyltransferase-like isoleucine patch superfamily enzyme